MALYVYITPECEADAKKHNRHDEMMRLKEKVEKAQRITHFDNFPPPYLKKRFDRQIRLLADYRTRSINDENHVVVSFIRVFVRSSNEYAAFLKDSGTFGQKHLEPLVQDEKVDAYLREQLKENPVEPKPQPTDAEYQFLYSPFASGGGSTCTDEFICESEQWVRKVQDEQVKLMLLHIFESLLNLIDSSEEKRRIQVRSHTLCYRWFPSLKKLFLAGLAENEADLNSIEKTYYDVLQLPENEVGEDLLLKCSMRTYTASLLVDEAGWLNVQKDAESNLALSPEETRVLESVHHHERGYPVFINGRAGSGKSTILYYLFSDYMSLFLELQEKNVDIHPPVLFSCSEDLARRAFTTVGNLIRCNPRWRKENQRDPVLPEACFLEFHNYLYSLLPDSDKLDFKQDQFVDYSRFRKMWERRFGSEPNMRKEAGPDLSWHIIRTYIKGTSLEDYLEPEEYEHLPRKQKSVSQAAYVAVFQKVWEAWYKDICEQKGYWDDQDLAQHVVANDLVLSIIPAVFCDEAQDFTRVELDILFRLCVFTSRRLGHSDITRVPYAFAGDPFQTLNPTGFRWDAIQASFHDKLTDTLGENIHRDISINYQELNLNYRSTKNVVRFCNLIQSMRASLFDLPKLRPQETWQYESSSPYPVWFDRDNRLLWNNLKDESDITIIVPCALNEEIEFVARDKLLRELVRLDEKNVPLNVLSPARAKGLEFGRVVLYAFADAAEVPEDLLALIDQAELDRDDLLPFEYFVNQLYVAASRPKKRLFIIDSQQGRDRLWKITSDEVQHKMWGKITEGRSIWEKAVGIFQVGTKESWSQDRGDAVEHAKSYEQQGMALKDPYLLRSAAMSYEMSGMQTEALKCKAEALRFEEQYIDAGDCFCELGDADEALRCYWADGVKASGKILSLGANIPAVMNHIEYKLIHSLSEPSVLVIHNQLKALCEMTTSRDGFASRLKQEKPFEDIVWDFVRFLAKSDTDDNVKLSVGYVDELAAKGLPCKHASLAEMHFKVGNMDRAASHWEECPKFQSIVDYNKAKSVLLASHYQKDPTVLLSQSDAVFVSNHMIETGNYSMALQPLSPKGTGSDLIKAAKKIPLGYPEWQELVGDLIELLAQKGEWEVLINMAFASRGNDVDRTIKPLSPVLIRHIDQVRNFIIRVCGGSQQFIDQSSRVLERYSDYFWKTLIPLDQWRETVPVEWAGAAIERAGRQRDILPFYEKIWDDPSFGPDVKQFARIRWIVTKEKQAQREEADGKRTNASKHMKEAEEMRREFGAHEQKLPEFPVIPMQYKDWPRLTEKSAEAIPAANRKLDEATERLKSIHETVTSTGSEGIAVEQVMQPSREQEFTSSLKDTTIMLGDIRLEFSPSRNRINLTHGKTMEQGTIRHDRKTFTSDDVEIVDQEGMHNCHSWGLQCIFTETHEDCIATISLVDSGVSVSLRAAKQAIKS